MSTGSVAGYQGKAIEVVGDGSEKFVKIKNVTSSAALTEGTVYQLTYVYSAANGLHADVVAVGTVATATAIICVVQNFFAGKSGIADDEWGWVQIAGVVEYCKTSGTVLANDLLEVDVNISTTAFSASSSGSEVGGGALGVADAAVAISNVDTNVWKVFLFGKQVAIVTSA
jgi:hypothetical protein